MRFDDIERDRFGLKRSQLFDGRLDGDTDQFAGGLDLQRLVRSDVEIRHVLVANPASFRGCNPVRLSSSDLLLPLFRRILQQRPEFVFVDATGVSVFRADHLLVQKIHDRVVERLHSVFLSDLQHAGNLECLRFADQVGDGRRDDQDFQRRHAALDIDALEQVLRDDAFQRFRERVADLVLLRGREDVDDAVDRLCRARRMQVPNTRWPVAAAVRPVRSFPGRAFRRPE